MVSAALARADSDSAPAASPAWASRCQRLFMIMVFPSVSLPIEVPGCAHHAPAREPEAGAGRASPVSPLP